ncbi:MAG: hypothetical protein HY903_02770, partial [Deltaproteobacteria bacterium]|nr:hypothetical protein [Deltaproteobacteria bacterium]
MQPLESTPFLDLAIGMGEETGHGWAVEKFGTARLGDARWRARLIAMGAEVARRPGGTVCRVFSSAAARQGAYAL